jgi:hypothetical protein
MTYSNVIPDNLSSFVPGPLSSLNITDLNPDIPFTTDYYKLLGVNATLVQPPLPAGHDVYSAIIASASDWKSVVPGQSSDQTTVGIMNLDQTGGDGEATGTNAVGDEWYKFFWPSLDRLAVALKQADATITFGKAVDMPSAS